MFPAKPVPSLAVPEEIDKERTIYGNNEARCRSCWRLFSQCSCPLRYEVSYYMITKHDGSILYYHKESAGDRPSILISAGMIDHIVRTADLCAIVMFSGVNVNVEYKDMPMDLLCRFKYTYFPDNNYGVYTLYIGEKE